MDLTLDCISKIAQTGFWFVGAVAAGFGVWKHFDESKEKRQWEKAKFAKEMVDDLDKNEKAISATYMLGAWETKTYELGVEPNRQKFSVNQEEVKAAFAEVDAGLSDKQKFIRECMDNFLFHLEQCVLAEQQGLVDWAQLMPLLVTFFAGIKRELKYPLVKYAQRCRYFRAATVLGELIEAALATPSTEELTPRSSGHAHARH
jgi:hypothetical protein